jgi:hypothetical protein
MHPAGRALHTNCTRTPYDTCPPLQLQGMHTPTTGSVTSSGGAGSTADKPENMVRPSLLDHTTLIWE